jgi:hypothetical protein
MNQAMQDAINRVSQAAAEINDPRLAAAIRGARDAAGFDDEDSVDSGTDEEGELDRNSAESSQPPAHKTEPVDTHPLITPPNNVATAIARNLPTKAPVVSSFSPKRPDIDWVFSHQPVSAPYTGLRGHSSRSGRMSPRFDYGLWLGPERTIADTSPPYEIAPYIDKTNLSATLYWASMAWGYHILKAVVEADDDTYPRAYRIAERAFGHSLSLDLGKDILDRINARLTFRKQGYLDKSHPGRNPEASMKLFYLSVQDLMQKGISAYEFLEATAVEEYVRGRLGQNYCPIESAIQGTGSYLENQRLRDLVIGLAGRSFCLGDGPRWKVDEVVRVVNEWTNKHSISFEYPAGFSSSY